MVRRSNLAGAHPAAGRPSDAEEPQRSPEPAATPRTLKTAGPVATGGVKKTPTERAREAGMVTRSWYLPENVASELDAAAGELAAVPGVTKHMALAALIQAGLRHRDDVRSELVADLQRQLAQSIA